MRDKLALEWSYTPADFFEEPLTHPKSNNRNPQPLTGCPCSPGSYFLSSWTTWKTSGRKRSRSPASASARQSALSLARLGCKTGRHHGPELIAFVNPPEELADSILQKEKRIAELMAEVKQALAQTRQ